MGTLGALLWKACFAQEVGAVQGYYRFAVLDFSAWLAARRLDLE
jgi:hypothetical protein